MQRSSVGPPFGGASFRFSSVTGDFAADAASAPAIVCRPPDFMLAGGDARRTRKPRSVNYENEKSEILCHATWGWAHCRPSPHPFLLGSWAPSETFFTYA